MVRKWSYLNKNLTILKSSELVATYSAYIFKIFRLTTRFKKYKRYKTTFLRKKYRLRKRRTNWFSTLRIFANWAVYYNYSKYLIRTYQSIFLCQYNCVLYNLNFFHKLIPTYKNILYFNTYFCSKKYQNFIRQGSYTLPQI
jgi:hypothetical protein